MSIQTVLFFKVVCGRDGCNRDNAAQGFTAALPTVQAALDDWRAYGGAVDPDTGVTLCSHCQTQLCLTCGEVPAVTTDRDGDPACRTCAQVAAEYPMGVSR